MSTSKTTYLKLNYLGPADSVTDDDWKFGVADRDRLDLAAFLGMSGHHHDGQSLANAAPVLPLQLTLDHSGGVLPAGRRIFYKYTLVDDRGFETVASPEAYVDTPNQITEPGTAVLAAATSGSLLPGSYLYALSAYKTATSLETTASNQANILLGSGFTYTVTLTLPPLPTGADGFNVYRRKPGNADFHYVASVNMNVATPPTTFTDNGTITEASDRGLPPTNTTNAQNEVSIVLPGATPTVPVGYTWRLYRSLISGQYANSLVHWVVEETGEGSGVISPVYLDLGYGTSSSQPPDTAFDVASPEPINLQNAAEVQGALPPANVVYKDVVEFAFPGALSVTTGTFAWRCPYEKAIIVSVTASLGRDSLAAGTDDIVDVNRWTGSSWTTIFTDQTKRPRIVVGSNGSAEKVPDVTALVKGNKLSVDVDQVGNAATPTDRDLLVQIVLWHRDTTATSIAFP